MKTGFKDNLAAIGLGNNTKIRHVIHSSRSAKSLTQESAEVRGKSLLSINKLINNSVLVESIENKKTEEKPDVAAYHRFYTPVAVSNGFYTVWLVAEERKNGRINPIQATLYDLMLEKNKVSPLP